MWMMQHDSRFKSTRELSHVLAPLPTETAPLLVRPTSGTEHVQVVAAKDQYSLTRDLHKVRAKVDNLHEVTLLAARRVRLPCSEDASTDEFIDRHQFGMFLSIIPGKINPNRQDFHFPVGRL